MEPSAGRRQYDGDLDPIIENRVQEVVRDTRHELRSDIAALAAQQASAALQATREHGEVQAQIQSLAQTVQELRSDLEELPSMRKDIDHLMTRDAVLDEVRRNSLQTRNMMIGLAGLIIAAAGTAIGLLT